MQESKQDGPLEEVGNSLAGVVADVLPSRDREDRVELCGWKGGGAGQRRAKADNGRLAKTNPQA